MVAEIIYRLKRFYHFFRTGLLQGLTAEIRYQFPARKLKIIVITGTDGKTTSSTLLYQVLKQAGKKAALISTVAAYVGDQEIDTGFHVTSPNPSAVHNFLRRMVKEDIEYLVMEATSHGIYQFRTWGINPIIAGITNVTHEHLDYHVTFENYLAAKAILLKKAKKVVLNADDAVFAKLKRLIKKPTRQVDTYSQEDRLYWKVSQAIQDRFPELYNQMNARLVYKIAQTLEINNDDFIKAVTDFPGVPGRMQFIPNKKGLRIVVDFAHTPNALANALTALRQDQKKNQLSGRLIAVFGCAGLRDRSKRPLMGQIGVDLADYTVFTAEDPRTEDIWSIIRQMKEQLTHGHAKVISIPDRKEAIRFALTKLARRGDTIGFFGKGHEKSLCYGTIEYAWSDEAVVNEILEIL